MPSWFHEGCGSRISARLGENLSRADASHVVSAIYATRAGSECTRRGLDGASVSTASLSMTAEQQRIRAGLGRYFRLGRGATPRATDASPAPRAREEASEAGG
jgi:hypothetical protein